MPKNTSSASRKTLTFPTPTTAFTFNPVPRLSPSAITLDAFDGKCDSLALLGFFNPLNRVGGHQP